MKLYTWNDKGCADYDRTLVLNSIKNEIRINPDLDSNDSIFRNVRKILKGGQYDATHKAGFIY